MDDKILKRKEALNQLRIKDFHQYSEIIQKHNIKDDSIDILLKKLGFLT